MTIIYFILILGGIVFIHESGHFICAKKSGVYCYEFSIGMGPRIIKWKRKNDETEYSIRLFPIGGYVKMAGEEIEEDKSIPKDKRMQSKTWFQKSLITLAGVISNFLLAIILLFVISLIAGAPSNEPMIKSVETGSNAAYTDLSINDKIISINGTKVKTLDRLLLEFQLVQGKTINLDVISENGKEKHISIDPMEITNEDGTVSYKYGMSLGGPQEKGFKAAVKYAFTKTISLMNQMFYTVLYLITGKLSINNLAGPIGIYQVVGETAKTGILEVLYLVALLSINVGFINLLPFPAFDGGRFLFLLIEKITRKPVNPKIENTIHAIGFILLMILMVAITYNDIIRLIK